MTTIAPPDDSQILGLLGRTGADRRKGEDALFHKYYYFIQEGMHRFKLSEAESFDAYGDAILSLTMPGQQASFEGRSSLKTFLFKIFLNKCVDRVRKNTTNKYSVHRTDLISDRLEQCSDGTRNILERLVDLADHQRIRDLLQTLGDNCRKMLSLWAEGFSDRDIHLELDYRSVDVVKTSRLRCLEKLRQAYKQQ